MSARCVVALVAAGTALCAAGCVTLKRTPSARHFFLRPVAEAPASAEARGTSRILGVLPVSLPEYLDRPQLVTGAAQGELRIDEFLRWAEPLDAGATRTLTENLGALLPGDRVLEWPWSAATDLRCRVRVEVSLFGLQSDGKVRLEGRWTLLPAQGEHPLVARSMRLSRGPVSLERAATEQAVAAMSGLLADLAREIADVARALPPEAPQSEG
jgi:uncharacterized protein